MATVGSLRSDVEYRRLRVLLLHVWAVSMRAWDCCMRECRWVCFHYIGGGGRWGLVRVHACTLCVRAAGRAAWTRTCVCRISQCKAG